MKKIILCTMACLLSGCLSTETTNEATAEKVESSSSASSVYTESSASSEAQIATSNEEAPEEIQLTPEEEKRVHSIAMKAFETIQMNIELYSDDDELLSKSFLSEAESLASSGRGDDHLVAWIVLKAGSSYSGYGRSNFRNTLEQSFSEREKEIAGLAAFKASELALASVPSLTLEDAYNAQRKSDAQTLANAFAEYQKDTGMLPSSLSSTPREICRTKSGSCENLVDIQAEIIGSYLVGIPMEPTGLEEPHSGYQVYVDGNAAIVTSIKNPTITASSADF